MEFDDARAGMADIEARQAQAVREAASWRWLWWYVAATAALMVGISVVMDFGQDPAMLIVVYCAGVSLLQIPLAADTGAAAPVPRTFRVNWPLAALLLAVAAVYVLARMALGAVGARCPARWPGC